MPAEPAPKIERAARAPKKTHLGWLGPIIVLVGVAAAGVAVWYMRAARPVPGEVIDTIVLDPHRTITLRREAKSEHSFIELREGGTLKWQALIPHYAGSKGRPGVHTERFERKERLSVRLQGQSGAAQLLGHLVRPLQDRDSLVCRVRAEV